MAQISKTDLKEIKLLAMDVDGVLTDGTITISSDGVESKSFNLLDGHGIKMWQRTGMKVALISGRESVVTKKRAEELEISFLYQPCKQKLLCFEKLLKETGLDAKNIAYIGDDLLDVPIVRRAGFGVAVVNGVDELKNCAHYVTSRTGGNGAVREVIEYILKNTGRWDALMERYLI
ncbi:MAG: phenylphosphate carboxylase subunit delta [Planctomycetes bacterium GWF2_41_51]|nr:MAG: phenylphosphate carboxylase subunit delta [Planctomycetes bacterium GWF2_41_51]HBG28062.1 phenylphosphate carboxylase subunit delta [Phycisphaerales bacterium]